MHFKTLGERIPGRPSDNSMNRARLQRVLCHQGSSGWDSQL